MNQLVLGVILLGTALPVAVGLIYGLGLLLALILIQILTQVQDPATMVLQTGRGDTLSEGDSQTMQTTGTKTLLSPEICGQYRMLKWHSVEFCISLICFFVLMSCCLIPTLLSIKVVICSQPIIS